MISRFVSKIWNEQGSAVAVNDNHADLHSQKIVQRLVNLCSPYRLKASTGFWKKSLGQRLNFIAPRRMSLRAENDVVFQA